MKNYTKYLLKIFLKYFILILFILTSIIWITRVINYLSFITEYGISLKNFLIIISYVIPNMLLITIPISIILTAITVNNKLIKNNELIILQNTGVSKQKLIIPIAILNVFIAIFMYGLTFYLIPYVNVKFDEMKILIKNDISNLLLKNTNFDSIQNLTFYADSDPIEENKLHNFILYIKPDENNKNERIIYSQEGYVNNNIVSLKNGNVQEYDRQNKDKMNLIFFKDYSFDLNEYYNIDFKKKDLKDDADLMYIDELFAVKDKTTEIKGEIAIRLLNPLFGFVFSIFACVLTLQKKYSRINDELNTAKIYFVSITLLSFCLYLAKSSRYNNYYIWLTVAILILTSIYNFLFINKKTI